MILVSRPNLGAPTVLGRRLLVEDEHDVVCHSLLGNQDLLVSIDDEITTLIISTLSGILHNIVLIERRKMAEF